jgi:MFS family permease
MLAPMTTIPQTERRTRGQIFGTFSARSIAFLSIAALSAALSVGLVLLVLDVHGFWRYPVGAAGSLIIVIGAARLIRLIPDRQVGNHGLRAVVWRVVAAVPFAFFGPWKPLLIPLFFVGVLLFARAASITVTLTRKQIRERRPLALALHFFSTALFVLAADWGVLVWFLSSFDPSPN